MKLESQNNTPVWIPDVRMSFIHVKKIEPLNKIKKYDDYITAK